MTIYAKLQSSLSSHQYGILGSKSQTSFTRNATRAGSEDGRLFSQASHVLDIGLELACNGGSCGGMSLKRD